MVIAIAEAIISFFIYNSSIIYFIKNAVLAIMHHTYPF
ncbi:putative membrane protein [Escherichia coli 1-182-04_S1_C3]|nr:putative membrane protein [Escherichia coli 1-182-04_S1_C3]